jgi:hypothetical protein
VTRDEAEEKAEKLLDDIDRSRAGDWEDYADFTAWWQATALSAIAYTLWSSRP